MYEKDRLNAQLFMLQQILLIKDSESKDEIEKLVQAVEKDINSRTEFFARTEAAKATTVKTSKLKKGKKYIFRVRPYRTVNGAKIYGAWVKTKAVKCK